MSISPAKFQALLDRILKIEERLDRTENDLRANEKEFELIANVLESHTDRLVTVEDKLFPNLRKTLGQLNRTIGRTDSKRYNSLDYPTDKPGSKKK